MAESILIAKISILLITFQRPSTLTYLFFLYVDFLMEYKQMLIVRTDLGMGKGKIAGQCAHASLAAYEKALKKESDWVDSWKEQGQAKIVVKVGSKEELLEWFEKLKKLFPCALIKDAGRTQIASGEVTCVGVGPAPENELNKFTKDLKLL